MEEEKNKTFFLPALEEKSIGEVSTDMKEIPFSNMDFLHLLVKYGIHIRMMSADSQYIIIEDINAILNTLWYKNLPMPMIIAEEKEIIATIDPDHRKQIRTVLDILFEKKKQEYLDCETKLKGYDAFQQEIQKYITVEEEMYEYCKGKGIEFVQEIVQEYIISPEKIQEYIKFAQYREEDERKRMQQHKKEKAEKYDLENLRPNDIFHSYETLDFVEDTYIQEKIQDYIFAEQKTWEYTFIKQKIQDHIFPQEMLLQKMQECIVYFQKVQDCCQKKIQKYFTQKMKEHTNSYQKIQKYMATLPRKSSGISNSIDMEMYMQQYIFSKRKIQEYSIFKEKISEYITAEEKRRSYCQQKLEEYHKTKHLFQDILWENMLIIKKIYHLPLNRGPLKFTDVTKEEKIIMPIVREGVFSLFVLPVKPDIVL